jgi:hypothetical protein
MYQADVPRLGISHVPCVVLQIDVQSLFIARDNFE